MVTRLSLENERLSKLCVLVADPVFQLRKIIHNILIHNIGVESVLEAANGEAALEIITDNPCDVLILDVSMRPLGGIELARRIREGEEKTNQFTPIIMTSDQPEMKDVIKARDVGVSEYLAKPLSPKILDLRLRALMHHPRPFVQSETFFGPDRRRHKDKENANDERRTHAPHVIESPK